MNNKFDELSKSLAQPVTRRGALKAFGAGLAGMALACFGLETTMKRFLLCVGGLLAASHISTAQITYQWTFEGHAIAPATATSFGYGPSEIGADGFAVCAHGHFPNTVFSGPVGNGSSQSFGANNWAAGDYWMFTGISTVGKTGLRLSWDQISSSDGPGLFRLQYNDDTAYYNWTDVGSDYIVLANTGANTWNSSNYVGASHYTVDLSSISVLNNNPRVAFRLVDVGTISAGGGSITIAGMNQVDNFILDVPDSDHDGILNDLDQCPDTPPGAIVDANGCSIEQLCPCDGPWKNHGEYVRHVADVASQFLQEGRISDSQRSSILEDAAASDCGKRK